MIVIVLSPLPELGETLNQLLLSDAVHDTFEETEKDASLPDDELKVLLVAFKFKYESGVVPDCVTETVFVIPPPETVTVALRLDVLVFAEFAVIVIVMSPLPELGETLNQLALLDAVHDTFEETEKVASLPDDELRVLLVAFKFK